MKFYLFSTIRTCFLMQLVLLTVFFVSVSFVRADIVTFQFTGELTGVDTPLEGEFSVGDTYSGTYTFESNTPDPEADNGFFSYPDAILDMSLSSGAFTASASGGNLYYDFEDVNDITASFHQDLASSLDAFVPAKMWVGWTYSKFGIPQGFNHNLTNGPFIYPGFDPDLPPFEVDPESKYFDANGNLVYDPTLGLVGNPDQPLFKINGSPAIRNGWFSFVFFDDGDQRSSIRGNLNSVTLISNIPSLIVPDNKWVQIGLNTAPPAGSTVANIIGDDISALYGSEWVVYSYQTSTNSYKQLSLTDTMLAGIGYWLIQVTGNPITIDMPNASTDVNVIGHPACTSFEGCFEIPLQTSNSIDTQWQMIGYPFRDSRNIDKVRVVTRDLGSDCFIGCTLKEANEKGLVSEPMYHFDETSYQQLTTEGSEPFEPWDGAWIATLPAASGQQPKLLIPATN